MICRLLSGVGLGMKRNEDSGGSGVCDNDEYCWGLVQDDEGCGYSRRRTTRYRVNVGLIRVNIWTRDRFESLLGLGLHIILFL